MAASWLVSLDQF